MKLLIVSGLDGVGKTSCLTSLCEYFEANKITYEYKWMRVINITIKPLLLLFRYAGITKKNNSEFSFYCINSLALKKLFVILKLFDLTLYFFINYFYCKLIKNKDYLIIDRFMYDVYADVYAITSFNLMNSLWHRSIISFLDQVCAVSIVISRNVEDANNCRPESLIDPQYLDRKYFFEENIMKLEGSNFFIFLNNFESKDMLCDSFVKFVNKVYENES